MASETEASSFHERATGWFAKALRRAAGSKWVAADAIACAGRMTRRNAQNLLAGKQGAQMRHLIPLAREYDDVWLVLAIMSGRESTLSPDLLPEVERVKAYLSEDRDE